MRSSCSSTVLTYVMDVLYKKKVTRKVTAGSQILPLADSVPSKIFSFSLLASFHNRRYKGPAFKLAAINYSLIYHIQSIHPPFIMKFLRVLLPFLIWNNSILVHGQQHQRRFDEERARRNQGGERKRQEARERQAGEEKRRQGQEKTEKLKEQFYSFFQGDDAVNFRSHLPKHIFEGIWNTVIWSGSAALAGTAMFVMWPVGALFAPNQSDSTSQEVGKVAKFIAGLIIGGITGGAMWIGGILYGLSQLIGGAIRTPKTLWCWIQGKNYWNNGTYTYYNLTQHAEELSNYDGGAAVQDDSLYQDLGVETTATPKEIKRAYYQLAKVYHPDKNPDAEEQFLKIHQAYEILYDDDRRKQYDEWGTKATGANGEMFDAGIFFDVVFGFSPELEPYIGDLAIKSFTKSLMGLLQSAGGFKNEEGQVVFQKLYATFFQKQSSGRDARQVDIALHLLEFSKQYVDGDMTQDEFREKCQAEAEKVFESTPFPIFVKTLGSALYWEGRGSFTDALDIPVSTMAYTRDKLHGGSNWFWYARNTIRFVLLAREKYEEAGESVRKEHPKAKGEEFDKLQKDKVFHLLLPSITDFVWKYNQNDIAEAIKGACWKLLHSQTIPKRKRKRRQAQALMILGKEFSRQTEVCQNNDTSEIGDEQSSVDAQNDEFLARLEVAVQMANSSVRIAID